MEQLSTYEKRKHDPNKPITVPGDSRIIEVKVAGVEMTRKTASIVIFENLGNPFVTGQMLIVDTENIASRRPLIGGELVEFTIEDCYQDRQEFKYYLTKVSDRSPISHGSLGYIIHFASKSVVLSSLRKISKAYPSTKTEEIAFDILKSYLDTPKLCYSPTAAPISCVIPNWRPAHALKWVASRSVSTRSEFANSPYLCFMEKDETVNFLPLDFLYNDATNIERGTITVKYGRPTSQDEATIQFDTRMGMHQLAFEDFEIVKTTDFIENLTNGMYYTAVTEIDMFARDSRLFESVYAQEFYQSTHLNKHPFIREGQLAVDETSYWRTRPAHDGLFSDESYTARIDEYTHHHISKWQQTEQQVIRGVLPGSFELRVGQKYRVEIPGYNNISENTIGNLDDRFTGNYIVEAIKHEFTPNNRYIATCQLFTDSMNEKVEVIR